MRMSEHPESLFISNPRQRCRIIALAATTLAAAACFGFPRTVNAQDTSIHTPVILYPSGEALDSYLRYLQSEGATKRTSLGVREPSLMKTRDRIPSGPHPWSSELARDSAANSVFGFKLLPARIGSVLNSGFPHGDNDGAVWAGRGATLFAEGGAITKIGPLVIQLAPIAFIAQNAAFTLQKNGQDGDGIFRVGQVIYANAIDLPQKFGPGSYARVDAGESEVRLESRWIMGGVSNAHRILGPASVYPFVLGTNAPGFPHAFVSTQQPWNLGFAKMEANVLWGELAQSQYSPVQGSPTFFSLLEPGKKRFASGATLILQPRGVPGLELGVIRFFESFWPRTGIPRSYLTKPFGNFLKKSLNEGNAKTASDLEGSDNQLLSVFTRWVLPHSGFEVYAEYGREDHAYDFRDLISEPDHSRTYMIGTRYAFARSAEGMSGLRAEIMNYEMPGIVRYRAEGGVYIHSVLHQGHTNRGQMLGAPLGPGASAGSTVAYDRFTQSGQTTISWTRRVEQEAGRFWVTGVQNPSAMDVSHSIAVSRRVFRGPLEWNGGFELTREFNRNFAADALNLNLSISTRYHFR
jgi:hypothetical protein